MKEDVFLLYEDDVHFSLLVDKSEGVDQVTSVTNAHQEEVSSGTRDFINDLHCSLFPGENIVLDNEVGLLDKTQLMPNETGEEENYVHTKISNCQTQFNPPKTSSKRKSSERNIVQEISGKEKENFSLRRSKRLRKKNTLDRILEIPSDRKENLKMKDK